MLGPFAVISVGYIFAHHLFHKAICVPREPSRWSLKHYILIPKMTSPQVDTSPLLSTHTDSFSMNASFAHSPPHCVLPFTCFCFQRTQSTSSAPWPPRGIWRSEMSGPRTCTRAARPNSSILFALCAMSTTTGTAALYSAGQETTHLDILLVENVGKLCVTPGGRATTAQSVSPEAFIVGVFYA